MLYSSPYDPDARSAPVDPGARPAALAPGYRPDPMHSGSRPVARGLGSRPTPMPGEAQTPDLSIWIGDMAQCQGLGDWVGVKPSPTDPATRPVHPWTLVPGFPEESTSCLSQHVCPVCLVKGFPFRSLSIITGRGNFLKYADANARPQGSRTIKKTVSPKE